MKYFFNLFVPILLVSNIAAAKGFIGLIPETNDGINIASKQITNRALIIQHIKNYSPDKNFEPPTSGSPLGFSFIDSNKTKIVLRTDLVIHLVQTGADVLSWITQISSGEPVRDAVIDIYNCDGKKIIGGVSDLNGTILFRNLKGKTKCASGSNQFFAFATWKKFESVAYSGWIRGYETWRYSVNQVQEKVKDKITTLLPQLDFHPGENVHMVHYLTSLKNPPVSVIFFNEPKNSSYEQNLTFNLDEFQKENEFSLPADALTGHYDIYFKYKDGSRIRSKETINVFPLKSIDAFIDIKTETQEIIESEPAYLEVSVKTTVASDKQIPLEVQYYFLRNSLESECQAQINDSDVFSEQLITDHTGKIRIKLPKLKVCEKPLALQIQVNYRNEFGEITSAYKSFQISPSDIQAEFSIKKIDLADRSISLSGTLKSKSKKASIGHAHFRINSFIKNTFVSRKRLLGGNYSLDQFSNRIQIPSSCEGETDLEGKFNCEIKDLPASELVFELKFLDSAKKEIINRISEDRLATQKILNFRAGKQLFIRAEKQFFAKDEDIQLKIQSPIKNAKALIIIEQNRILSSFPVDIDNYQSTIIIPHSKKHFPNIFISALLVRKNVNKTNFDYTKALTSPVLKLGVTEVMVGWESHRLNLNLSSEKKIFNAEEVVNVKINLKNPDSKNVNFSKTDVTLFATRAGSQSANASLFIIESLMPEFGLDQTTSSTQNIINDSIDAAVRLPILGAPLLSRLNYPTKSKSDGPLLIWKTHLKPNAHGDLNFKFKLPEDAPKNFYVVAVAASEGRRFGTGILPLSTESENSKFKVNQLDPSREPKNQLISLGNAYAKISFRQPTESKKQSENKDTEKSFLQIRSEFKESDTFILDKNNFLINWQRKKFQYRQFPWLEIESVSPEFIKVLLAAEDKNFFSHEGVDWASLTKAGFIYLRNWGPRIGASTITMQLATLLNPNTKGKIKSVSDKVAQIKTALNLEKTWSKNQILEAYLNLVPFRGELVGLHVSSYKFFNKEPKKLSTKESAFLVSLIRSPNSKSELISKRACLLDPQQCDQLSDFVSTTLNKNYLGSEISPFPDLLVEQGSAEKESGIIRTTLDISVQKFAENSLKRHLKEFQDQNLHDGAIVIIDNRTKEIIAYVANSGSNLSANAFVDNIQAYRQAGSTLKPFVYATAIEKKLISMNTSINDDFFSLAEPDGNSYSPKNFTLQNYGSVSAAVALGSSLNIPAVKVFQIAGETAIVQNLKKLGFENISAKKKYGASLALGSIEVTLLNLTQAYSTLLTGTYFKKSTRDQITLMLSNPLYRNLTFGTESVLTLPFNAAVKTGTSNDTRDSWCVGSIGNYTIGIWTGNSNGQAPANIGNSNAAYVWRDIAMELHQADPKFEQTKVPSGLSKYAPETDRTTYINRPSNNEVFGIDPEFPLEIQKIPIELKGVGSGINIELNGSTLRLDSNPGFIPVIKGKYILKILTKERQVLDEAHFSVE